MHHKEEKKEISSESELRLAQLADASARKFFKARESNGPLTEADLMVMFRAGYTTKSKRDIKLCEASNVFWFSREKTETNLARSGEASYLAHCIERDYDRPDGSHLNTELRD